MKGNPQRISRQRSETNFTQRQTSHERKRTRRRRLPLLLASLAVASMVVGGPVQLSQRPGTPPKRPRPTPSVAQRAMMQETSKQIRRVARVLAKAGLDIDASSLFTRLGRSKLRPSLARYGEMYLTVNRSEPLSGVVMAHTLRLAEKMDIADDTVIIANHIRFTGKAPVIKGPHDVHFFAVDSVAAEQGPGTVITIDTSGLGRKEWLESKQARLGERQRGRLANHTQPIVSDGTAGSDGVSGTPGQTGNGGGNGSSGQPGSCSTVKNGGNGGAGAAGSAGGNGNTGGNGAGGTAAGAVTLTITDPTDSSSYNLSAVGGQGGNGGDGGSGGTGGTGGDGGRGGDGAGCSCASGGIGDGGNGGAAGAGGTGGTGNKGGNGGPGGPGASISVSYPWGYNITNITTNTHGGAGGRGGSGGAGGTAGSAGSPGGVGHGGSIIGCDAGRDGQTGASASGGAGGSAGAAGDAGQAGTSGSVSWSQTTDPSSGGGYEPGGLGGGGGSGCTDWWFVWYHCDWIDEEEASKASDRRFGKANHFRSHPSTGDWECIEEDRWYVGCF